jgi:hypothetical protein
MKPLARVVVAVVSLAAVATSYLLPNSQQTFSSPASEFAIDVNPLPLSSVCPGGWSQRCRGWKNRTSR